MEPFYNTKFNVQKKYKNIYTIIIFLNFISYNGF